MHYEEMIVDQRLQLLKEYAQALYANEYFKGR